nr:hypothetical protein [uncultured Lachnoclostridium sp.]
MDIWLFRSNDKLLDQCVYDRSLFACCCSYCAYYDIHDLASCNDRDPSH